jgi:predicted AAA+ superfamily ATPase
MKNREHYLQKLVSFKDKNIIKVITGVRRCGKSMLLKLFMEYLAGEGDVAIDNILYINFESMEYENLDYKSLYDLVKQIVKNNRNTKTYLLFDEVQRVKYWEKTVNSLFVDFDVDIYITGSNAYLLSSELATYLAGRHVEIKMLPLSFKEFLDFNSFAQNSSIEDKFNLYLKYGGLPSLSEFNFNEEQINDVLDGIYSSIVMKDIMQQIPIKDSALLKKITLFLADNIGNINSPNKIGNMLNNFETSRKKGIPNSKTIENYIKLLNNAFIFYNVKRYDVKGKECLKTLEKHYIVDIGLRNYLLGYRDVDMGHVLENVVYLELIRRNYKVYIGKINDKEVDFIAVKQNEKIYYQVSQTIKGEETRNRELESLRMIDDNHEKIILTMDKDYILSQDGIKIKNIIDFMMET